MEHVQDAPYHPQIRARSSAGNQALKNRILLANCYLPEDLEAGIGRFIDYTIIDAITRD